MDGFSKLVEDAWKESPGNETNVMLSLMGKLRFLKTKIRAWNKTNMASRKNMKEKYKIDLEAVEGIIDNGKGDENSSFFHGTLSKKQSVLSVRGIMVDGLWIDDPRLSTDQQIELESEVSNEEIKRAVWDCGTEKAPGPDGFTFGFYRQFWYLIENDVYNAVNLIGSLYKIIAKILANRLVGKLGKIVNKRKKKQLLVFKVDFEKAYDSVRWDFLDDILRKFGFGDKWCKWIQTCLRSSRGSIILNGSPTKEFKFYKCLKQGDPLSPFTFILVMESLHLSFQRVEEACMFKGIMLDNSVSISYMFYADDAVFVGQCDKIKGAASKFGCLTFKTPFMYLGSIVGGSMSRIQAWADVVDRVSSRLSKWKMNILSIGSRLTLLKSIALAYKEKGGLGISSLYALNKGLMFKWFWRFCTQDTSLWSRVIKAIYGETRSVDGNVNSGFKTCWMNIVQEVNSLVGKGIDLRKFICFKLGNRENARFWDDRWLDGEFFVASVRRLIDDKTLPDAAQKTRLRGHDERRHEGEWGKWGD
nr:RNA-directed DNA polymerase, eukaryota, reverse transcriptase zinc-binding domain protein [Tanacetum cinerariifolium]